MEQTVELRVVRPLLVGGITHPVGETVIVSASVAVDLIASGRARLVDPADLGLITDAEERHKPGVWRTERPRWPRMVRR